MKNACFILLLLTPFFSLGQAGSGTALDLNGSSSFASAGTINLSNNQITMMTWVKVDAFKASFPFISSIMGTEQPGNTALLRLGDASLAANRTQFVLTINGNQAKLDGVSSLAANRWYHLAATYDGTQMRIYIDGELDASLSMTGPISSNDLFEIGRNYGNARILDGSLDEMTVWDTALPMATIREWMCKKLNSNHPDYTNLLAYWRFDEGSGTVSADLSPNSNSAILTSSPGWVTSGAYVGDVSVQAYAGILGLSLAHPDGDSIEVVATGGSLDGLHLYRVDSVPNTQTTGAGLSSIDTTRYWGAFRVGTGNYTLRYNYGSNLALSGQNDCFFEMGRRVSNASGSWVGAPGTNHDLTADTIQVFRSASSEFIAGTNVNTVLHNLTFTSTNVLCNGNSNGSLSVQVTGGPQPYNYQWSVPGSTDSLNSLPAGTYVLTLTDNSSCTSIDSVVITEPAVLIATGLTAIDNDCMADSDGTVQANTTGGTMPYSYLWNDANSQATVSANGLPNGNYMVTVTDVNGCSDTAQAAVTNLFPDPVPTLGTDTSLCAGDSIGLSPTGSGTPYLNFAWSDGSNLSFNNVMAGTYTVTVTNINGCEGISGPVVVSAFPLPTPNLGPDLFLPTPPANLDAGTGYSVYDWSTGANTQTISVTIAGTYFVLVTDTNGCQGRDTIDVGFAPIGIEEINNGNWVSVFPNPSSGQVRFEVNVPIAEGVTLEVMDLSGRSIMYLENQQLNSTSNLDLSALRNGTYFVRIKSKERTEVLPIVLQH